ncbi:hypothetical protein K470DRAFT_56475 [Piedraia hortae CBS 480.64]|uniref:Uncharacterized protein n=1 Tax=Piedraia hortae CBS 480.64 TaxID=1314780 RepID=A0A6A7C119_9PEZI|nr:hypothetical protein K470DRAFT_56475 [Piedraia hortae CBS 480.64]
MATKMELNSKDYDYTVDSSALLQVPVSFRRALKVFLRTRGMYTGRNREDCHTAGVPTHFAGTTGVGRQGVCGHILRANLEILCQETQCFHHSVVRKPLLRTTRESQPTFTYRQPILTTLNLNVTTLSVSALPQAPSRNAPCPAIPQHGLPPRPRTPSEYMPPPPMARSNAPAAFALPYNASTGQLPHRYASYLDFPFGNVPPLDAPNTHVPPPAAPKLQEPPPLVSPPLVPPLL